MYAHALGYAAALAFVAIACGVALWAYERAHRTTAWLFGIGAFFLAAGVTVWTDSLAALTASGPGFTVLIIVFIVGGIGFFLEAIRKPKKLAEGGAQDRRDHHHRVRTPVIAVAFGTALMLVIGSAGKILSDLATTPGKTGAALSLAAARIRSPHVSAAAHSHNLGVLAIGVAIFVAVIVIASNTHKKQDRARRGSGQLALPAGKGR